MKNIRPEKTAIILVFKKKFRSIKTFFRKSLLSSLCQREVLCPSLAKRGEGRFSNACHFSYILVSLMMIATTGVASAKEEVGSVVAVRGKTLIDREAKATEAKVKDNILFNDTVSTLEASKAKMLFIDDSVLTLGEKSKVVVKEFIYSKEKGGKSIFNLIDGKMRTVVGKTGFEVHTPTAVAAARGTVILFETGVIDGRKFTTIICLEGEVNITSIDPSVRGSITLTAGMMITIFEGEAFPAPTVATAADRDRLTRATDIRGNEITITGPAYMTIGAGRFDVGAAGDRVPAAVTNNLPPINQQPVIRTIPVNINITFPQ